MTSDTKAIEDEKASSIMKISTIPALFQQNINPSSEERKRRAKKALALQGCPLPCTT
jgi:uncharacterized metal-binding protein